MNKCQKEQIQNLEFLGKLKLFCVLDFDPNSAAPDGLCTFYRNVRVANLHVPALVPINTTLMDMLPYVAKGPCTCN